MKLTNEEIASIREDFETALSIYPPDTKPDEFMDVLSEAIVINIDQITDRWFEEVRTRIDRAMKEVVIEEVKENLEVDNAVQVPQW